MSQSASESTFDYIRIEACADRDYLDSKVKLFPNLTSLIRSGTVEVPS
jgi:hypothetical protein